MKKGDLVWQTRHPGGWCVVLDIIYHPLPMPPEESRSIWAAHDYPIITVHHPTEGVVEDPSYYYEELTTNKLCRLRRKA
jgi:hypothetical protein